MEARKLATQEKKNEEVTKESPRSGRRKLGMQETEEQQEDRRGQHEVQVSWVV